MSYEIYSDESGSGNDRHEAVGVLSVKEEVAQELRFNIKEILDKYQIKYCEYKTISGVVQMWCAKEILNTLVAYSTNGSLKLTVLVWDKHDARHNVKRRDDCKNLSIMYYHALRSAKRMWMDTGVESSFYPDELSKIDFENIIRYIENGKLRSGSDVKETLFGREFQRMFPKIINHKQKVSKEELLIQAIDIITGVVRLSYEEYDKYYSWNQNKSGQQCLFDFYATVVTVSKNKEYKYNLIQRLDELCKGNKLQVALKSTQGFSSHKPSVGIWFWKYIPQTLADKAPTYK
jgi:hypothetical protein